MLLNYLVDNLKKSEGDFFYLFDKRCGDGFDFIPSFQRRYISNSVAARTNFYKDYRNCFDQILCFSNVPPPLRSKATTYTFFHNVLLCQVDDLLPWRAKKVTSLKQYFIQNNLRHTDFFIVQTEYVKECFLRRYRFDEKKVLVWPFYDDTQKYVDNGAKDSNKFLYVSDGNPHKNHLRLLEAWMKVNEKNESLHLHLTVSNRYPRLLAIIDNYIKQGVRITNHGILSKEELNVQYATSKYLIYPSTTESFGLGIIEAIQNGCDIVAADKSYVHSVCEPLLTFDETNPEKIAIAVLDLADRRFSNNGRINSNLIISNKLDKWISVLEPCAELPE